MAPKKIVVSPTTLPLFSNQIMDDGTASLTVLKERCLACKKCKLHETRTNAVFGEGLATRPSVAFVGEGPGQDEDKSGRPFVGRAGSLLDEMIRAMGFSRSDVFITNVVACRPPGNRVPDEDEIKACNEFLFGQLHAVRPKIIVALGNTASKVLCKSARQIGELRGQWHTWQDIPLRATYHPAYLLRNQEAKTTVWEDLQKVLKKLESFGKS